MASRFSHKGYLAASRPEGRRQAGQRAKHLAASRQEGRQAGQRAKWSSICVSLQHCSLKLFSLVHRQPARQAVPPYCPSVSKLDLIFFLPCQLPTAMEYMCTQLDLRNDQSALYQCIRIQQTVNVMPAAFNRPSHGLGSLSILLPVTFPLFGRSHLDEPAVDAVSSEDAMHESSPMLPLCYRGASSRAFQPYSRPRIFRRFPRVSADTL